MGNNESQIRDDDINLHKKMTQDASNGETIRYGEFDQLFMRFDDNNSDSLTEDEFKKILTHYIKIHPEHRTKVEELKDNIRITDQTPLTKEEFRKLMYNYLNSSNENEKLIEIFKIFDKNMTAEITCVEIIHVFTKLGLTLTKEDVESMLLEADDSGDGTLDFEEFIKIMIAK